MKDAIEHLKEMHEACKKREKKHSNPGVMVFVSLGKCPSNLRKYFNFFLEMDCEEFAKALIQLRVKDRNEDPTEAAIVDPRGNNLMQSMLTTMNFAFNP